MSKRLAELLQQEGTQLDALRVADADGQRLAQHVTRMVDEHHRLVTEIERGTRVNDRAHAAVLAMKGDVLVRATRASIQQLVAKSATEMETAVRETEALTARARTLQMIVSLLGVAAGLAVAIFTAMRINAGVDAVRKVAASVAGSSGELKAATQSISQRVSEEAASLEETSSTMEEMTTAVDQNRAGAQRARELAEQNRDAARQGAEVAAQAAEAMRALKEAGAKISDISDTVNELAFQTNILALNASVEAARAGEHGRGFTVVASEVRSLAQRSGAAAREISALIRDSIRRIERGAELVSRASHEMGRVVDVSRDVTTIVANISAATQEQASGITQVSQAVLQINQVVQGNSAQAEEMAATADGLDEMAQDLVRAVALISGVHDDFARHAEAAATRPPERGSGPPRANGSGGRKEKDPPAVAEPLHGSPRSGDFHNF
jgi:hypothetical protein